MLATRCSEPDAAANVMRCGGKVGAGVGVTGAPARPGIVLPEGPGIGLAPGERVGAAVGGGVAVGGGL